jgi:hypothetical protein
MHAVLGGIPGVASVGRTKGRTMKARFGEGPNARKRYSDELIEFMDARDKALVLSAFDNPGTEGRDECAKENDQPVDEGHVSYDQEMARWQQRAGDVRKCNKSLVEDVRLLQEALIRHPSGCAAASSVDPAAVSAAFRLAGMCLVLDVMVLSSDWEAC